MSDSQKVGIGLVGWLVTAVLWVTPAFAIVFDQHFVGEELRRQRPFQALWGHMAPYTDHEGVEREGVCVWELDCQHAPSWDAVDPFEDHLTMALAGGRDLTGFYLDAAVLDTAFNSLLKQSLDISLTGEAFCMVGSVVSSVGALLAMGSLSPLGFGGCLWMVHKAMTLRDVYDSGWDFYFAHSQKISPSELLSTNYKVKAPQVAFKAYKTAIAQTRRTQGATRGHFASPCPPPSDFVQKRLGVNANWD